MSDMKILKPGNIAEPTIWIGRCRSCKAILEAQTWELESTWRAPGKDAGRGVCQCCGRGTVDFTTKWYWEQENGKVG